ncbi:MAG: NACHT domain-containing protein [Leptolyngbyaceae cyanobacterium]
MWEWLAVATGAQLGKLVLERILNLSKSALEGYVQEFFGNCLESGVARLQASTLKTPMAEAIGYFIKRFVKELQFNDVPDTSISHHYTGAIKRFVQDKAVCALLGKAFEAGCKRIDYEQLAQIWTAQYQDAAWQFPAEDFDWRGVAKEYVVEVKGIVKANPELRALLETELLEAIAQNTTQISPGFDVIRYRESLQASYGYLKLYTLDSTDGMDAIKLWNLFIEQTVREALPPSRYELPLDLKRQLQADGQLAEDLSSEALELYHREYFQQPSRKVLEAAADSQRAVILGDPGAGKSTLLQYLALEWVEGKTETLPLLIELREYVLAQSANFLEFLHHGRGADWQFDQLLLHQHLSENPTLVMFDGLDEVFDRPTQSAVIDDIIRFAQQYPQARVLVTSRIIGYNPDRFQQAGFRQFTIQPLDETEIHAFIDRWYDLAMGSDPDKVRLKQRLKDAIANSKAIQNLADNPLLLTMMAILNRRQELPRDRADLYDQASRVLLYHWDVDHKRLNLPLDAIGRREKQEILRAIAYEMQAGEEGLKGNLISADRLIRILTDYLRDQGFSEPREKANRLIQQLRERNFILCYRGADTYGFMHRTFLEYFCAVEIVHRFEKQRTLTFDQLRDEVFGQHWQDETWHEVLQLICGLVSTKFSKELIESLIDQKYERRNFVDPTAVKVANRRVLAPEGILHLVLATRCLSEIGNQKEMVTTIRKLLGSLKKEISVLEQDIPLGITAARFACRTVAKYSQYDSKVLLWLKEHTHPKYGWEVKQSVIEAVASQSKFDSETFDWLQDFIQGNNHAARFAAVRAIASHFRENPETPRLLQNLTRHEDHRVRREAIIAVSRYFKDSLQVLKILAEHARNDEYFGVRELSVKAISDYFGKSHKVFELLCQVVCADPFQREEEWHRNPRKTALQALLLHYSNHSEIIRLLNDRAENDSDEQLRQWAQKQLLVSHD